MKNTLLAILLSASIPSISSAALVISQYAEDGDIKGVEIWNSGPSDITFNGTDSLLQITNYNNGSTSATYMFSKSTGTIASGEVLVFADGSANAIWSDSGIAFEEANFSFNGNDAVTLRLGGVVLDMFGLLGTDPGTHWSGGGVTTRDQNISLAVGIASGDADGWTDPSARFVFVAQNPLDSGTGTDLAGFGVAPVPEPSAALLSLVGLLFLVRRRK